MRLNERNFLSCQFMAHGDTKYVLCKYYEIIRNNYKIENTRLKIYKKNFCLASIENKNSFMNFQQVLSQCSDRVLLVNSTSRVPCGPNHSYSLLSMH